MWPVLHSPGLGVDATQERAVGVKSPFHGEVTIVGAGPSGLACAIVLARAGWEVVVREWHDTVGSRFHGDFQGLENWSDEVDALDELAAYGIQATFEHHAVSGGVAFDAWGESYAVDSAQPFYYLVHRGDEDGSLDQALLDQARSAGVIVRFQDRVERAVGPVVLAAGPRFADVIAAGYLFETDSPEGSFVAFNNSLAPLGYAYLLVNGGRGTVACCIFTGFKRQQSYVSRTVEFFRRRVGLEMRNPRPFGGYGNVRLPATAIQGGHLVIGEQAGFQDALAGFGMRYALRSGIMAAKSLLEGKDYASMWREALLPQLQTGIVNRFLFSRAGKYAWRWMLKHRLNGGDTRAELRRLYQPSVLKRVLFPLAHWQYRAPLSDSSCNHVDCECVWCGCGGSPTHPRLEAES